MDTVGALIDKLFTVDQKMFLAQEKLYVVRRMTLTQFTEWLGAEGAVTMLWRTLTTACDLNLQRNALIDEIDETVVRLVRAAQAGEELEGKFIQRKAKTY